MYELIIAVPLFCLFFVLSRMTAGPPTGQTGVKLNMPSATDKRTSDDMHTSDDMPEDDTDTPSARERSSFNGQGYADNSLAQVVSAVISTNVVTRHRECKDCSRYCTELYDAKLEMVSALRSYQSHSARRNTDYGVQLSRRLRDVLFSAIKAFRAMGYDARCHAWTHYHDYATPATGKSTAATSAPANDTSVAANASSVTGCLLGDRSPAGRTQTATSPVAPILPASSLTAAPLVGDTTSAPSQDATTFEATTTPAPFQVAAASTDTTPAVPYQVAAPSAPSNNSGAANTAALANSTSTLSTSSMVDNASPANVNSAGDSTLPENNTSTPPASSTVDNAASVHITGAAIKTSSASNSSELPGNDSVGCSTPAKRKRATDILSQSDVEEAFRWKEWRPGCLDPYPNAKRGRRRQLLRNASVLNNMANVPTQQRAHNTFRKRVAALVRHIGTNSGAVTGCLAGDKPTRGWLPGDRPPAARTQTVTLPAAPTPPASSQTATPLVDTTPSGPSQTATSTADISTAAHTLTATSAAVTTTPAPSEGAATFEATMTPAPFQVAAASTDTTPAASYQVAAPSAPSNNGASLGLNPAGQGATDEHTPALPVNFTAYRLPSKMRAPSTGVKRARQTPSFIARRLQKVVVVKQCNPADRSKIRRIAVPIRTRQSLKGRYRSLGTRHYLGRLGLGFRANGVSVRQRFTNSVGAVRLGSGMTLRDNRLRRRRRTSSVNEIRARQRQRARKEMCTSQRLRKYPATTPDINVIPATPPAIPNGGGATGWLPVGWSNFGQGAQTDVTTPAHVQLATTPAPPTLTGPTQAITPIGPTQATFMTATPALPTAFAPTGIAPTGIAPTGIAPTIIPPAAPAASTQTALVPTAFVLPAAPVPSGIAQTSFSPAAAMPANPTQAAFSLSALAQAAAMSAAPAPTGLAQTTIATPPHNPPTTFVGQTGPTQFTSMPAVPTGPAPTGSAQATIPPAAPTGFAPTTTATASPASNGPSQAGLTLPPPTSTGPAPPATNFTFTSTSGPSRTQPQTNISVQRGSGSRGRQSGRLSNRLGKVSANQQARPAEPPVDTYVSQESYENSKLIADCRSVVLKYGWITKRRRHLRTAEATHDTLTVDRMYYALVYITAKELKDDEDPTELERQLRELYDADDMTIRARYERMIEIHPSRALVDKDV
ncbi:hypothetical protein GGI09_000220 [Coemansia sp. S100]|nr:hypothetical protein GGI09_000220 [Coemansia sp. S100]